MPSSAQKPIIDPNMTLGDLVFYIEEMAIYAHNRSPDPADLKLLDPAKVAYHNAYQGLRQSGKIYTTIARLLEQFDTIIESQNKCILQAVSLQTHPTVLKS